MRLESSGGPLDLALGIVLFRGKPLLENLSASKWQLVFPAETPNGLIVARKISGKEVSLVFLEEQRGKFLLIRRKE